jgi:hypothetical protein
MSEIARSSAPGLTPGARPDLTVVTVCRWPDPLLDRFGYDPRSPYVERFWLPIIGPSGTVMLRRLAEGFDSGADEYPLDLADAAHALGMGRPEGPSASFRRTLDRVASFGFIRFADAHTLAVRPCLPGLTRRQLQRLPPALRADHDAWHDGQPDDEVIGARVQHLAASLLQLGEEPPAVEDHLLRLDFHPTVVHRALRSALDGAAGRHRAPAPRPSLGDGAA